MSDGLLEREWQGFAKAACHPDTPAWQRAEMRRIFFAGALSMRNLLASDITDAGIESIEAEFDALGTEIHQMAQLADVPPAGRA